ncbi:MAG: nickel pincer cofactor biosynthesis protein LarC [Chloroflexota bacterium]
MRIAYFDCFSGISGNMILGALLDAGLPLDDLRRELNRLTLSGYEIEATRVTKQGLAATYVAVRVQEEQPERRLGDILAVIARSSLSERVKDQSQRIFTSLAAAEGRVHDQDAEVVHLHEVGAVDAMVDIVGTAIGLQLLGIERVECSPLNLGHGFVRARHGVLPVPAPATLELLRGVPVYSRGTAHELVTPTGAAIVASLAARFGPLPPMTVEGVGYGAGKADLKRPNLLRLVLGQDQEIGHTYLSDAVTVLETNLDDMNPQFYDYVMERLFAAGALDVYLSPIQMKKNRPGVALSVLCHQGQVEEMLAIIFAETSTLGVRVSERTRRCLERSTTVLSTRFGEIRVKVARRGEAILHVAPEYEDCKRAARQHGVTLSAVYQEATRQAIEDSGLRSRADHIS